MTPPGAAGSWQLEGVLRQLSPTELRQAVHDAVRERDEARAELRDAEAALALAKLALDEFKVSHAALEQRITAIEGALR